MFSSHSLAVIGTWKIYYHLDKNLDNRTENGILISWVRGKAPIKSKVDWLNTFYADGHYNKSRK